MSLDDKSSKSSNITDDIAKELQGSDYTSKFENDDDENDNTLLEENITLSEQNSGKLLENDNVNRNNREPKTTMPGRKESKEYQKLEAARWLDRQRNLQKVGLVNTDSSSTVSSSSNLFGDMAVTSNR